MKASIAAAAVTAASLVSAFASSEAHAACTLANGIQHVVYMQFDNTHFLRDNASVPSDLEQMPHLLNFLEGKGMLLENDHTQLISHTANGILTTITGVYPDRSGAGAISNSFNYYNSQTNLAPNYSSTFVYWTNKLTADTTPGGDNSYILLAETGKNAPAPWVPYTRAGCDFAAAGIADMDLENTSSDLANVFGPTSAEYAEGTSSSGTVRNQAVADFEGIALHCAPGSAVCANVPSNSKLSQDLLPDEPGGYTGFNAIFGHKYVVPALKQAINQRNASNPNYTPLPVDNTLTDLSGNPIGYLTVSTSNGNLTSSLQTGFPGFDGMFPAVTLAYAATALEAGVPIVFGYFSDAHDHHYATVDGVNPPGSAFAYGPGEQGYVNQLKQYDQAFSNFFTRLQNDGINETNTLFVILVEEGDRFAGAKGVPAGCDGVTTPCTYPPIATTGTRPSKGEVAANLDTLLAQQRNDTIGFNVHTDQAPAFWLNGNPAPTDPTTRTFERDLLALTIQEPYLNRTIPAITAIADRPELQVLHMVTADPLRTPTTVGFDYDTIYAGVGAVTTSQPGCAGQSVCTNPGFAWNHGGIQAQVRQTWSGMVGPGVKNVGLDTNTWADHVDTRPTMFAVLGLHDDYAHDGRVLAENLVPGMIQSSISSNMSAYVTLAAAYKQLTAPFGTASTASLRVSTNAIGSGTTGNDAVYTAYVTQIQNYLAQRDPLIAQIKTLLNSAEAGTAFDAGTAQNLANQANQLTAQMVALAGTAAQ